MTSPATLNHFPPPSISLSNSNSSNHRISIPIRPRIVGVRISPSPIAGARRRRISNFPTRASDSTVIVDDPLVSSSSTGAVALGSSLSEEEEAAAAAAEKIGARVRVSVPLKVYHVPKVPEIDITGMEGVLKQYVALWKGKRISANLPFKVEFFKEIDGRRVKFFAHLKEDEFEYLD